MSENVALLGQLAVNGLIAGSMYGMIGLGLGLIYSTTRIFHFAHGAVYTAGAYCAYALLKAGVPLLLVAPLAVAGTALLGMALEFWMYRPLRKAQSTPRVMLIASLGAFIVIQNVIALIFKSEHKLLRGNAAQLGHVLFGVRFTNIHAAIVAVNLLLYLLAWLGLRASRLGRNVRALMNDAELAHVVGLPRERLTLTVFAFGSAVAGVAALLNGFNIALFPTMGLAPVLMGVVAFIVGGADNPTATIWGGFLIGLTQHLSGAVVPARWGQTAAFFMLIIFLILKPQGIAGRPLHKATV